MLYPSKVLVTFGIGDFIAIDAFSSDEERSAIEEVYFACRSDKPLRQLFKFAFPNLKKTVTFWDAWTSTHIHSVGGKDHLYLCSAAYNWGLDLKCLFDVADWCVNKIFPEIRSGNRPYVGTCLLNHKLANISRFNLPDEYGIINHCTPYYLQLNGQDIPEHKGRDLNERDWAGILRYLEKMRRPAIVISQTSNLGSIPKHDLIVNLNNETTILEAIEICKLGKFYLGIDSWVPALMSKVLPPDKIEIKSVSDFYMKNADIYCAPHKSDSNLSCIHRSLQRLCCDCPKCTLARSKDPSIH